MKLKHKIQVGKQIIEAGTELEFDLGIANHDGTEIELRRIPIEALEYEINEHLNSSIFDDMTMKTEVREKLLNLANKFYEDTGFKAEIKDIV